MGSVPLIYDPGCLKIQTVEWKKDGPKLPIEFARISSDKRITLVIHTHYFEDESKWVTTYWNNLDVSDIDEARENLRQREGCPSLKPIGFVYNDIPNCKDIKIGNIIRD